MDTSRPFANFSTMGTSHCQQGKDHRDWFCFALPVLAILTRRSWMFTVRLLREGRRLSYIIMAHQILEELMGVERPRLRALNQESARAQSYKSSFMIFPVKRP